MTAEAVCATCPHGESEHQDIESRDEPPQPCCLACANALIDDPWDDTVRGFKPYHPFKLAETDADAPSQSTEARCHAGQDGDCIWSECPQNRDGEPQKSGRSCPIYAWHLDEEGQPWPVAAARPEPPVEGALEEARMFPVQVHEYQGHKVYVPWSLVAPHEAQAQRNHSQSLETLAERGGLSAHELAALLRDEHWHERTARDDEAAWRIIAAARSGHDGLLTASAAVVGKWLLSHASGGDPGMIFDSDDADVEYRRPGHWKVDERGIQALRAAVEAARREANKVHG